MAHALVENGVVTQLDLTGSAPDGYIECDDTVQPGYLFDGETWTPPPTPEPPEAVIVVYPVDLWSRLTDDEADQVESVMATQSTRTQNIFRSANSYRSDHELWSLLVQIAADLFGETRASEILAPSDV